jgi:hypothetical protein
MITNKTTTTEKRILKRTQRILPLVLLAISKGPMGDRYLEIFQRYDTVWDIEDIASTVIFIPINQMNWKFLREIKDKISIRIKTPTNELKHLYVKRCKVCQNIYYRKEITQDQFDVFSGNDNIHVSLANDTWSGEITSCCDGCAED